MLKTDLLSDILDTIALRGQLYFRTCFNGPWAIAVPSHPRSVRFHYAMQGHCYLRVEGGQGVRLEAGDLALIPAGAAHAIADDQDGQPKTLETVLADTGFAGDGALILSSGDMKAATQLLCGHFTFAEGSDHPLLRALPPILLVTNKERRESFWLDEALRLMSLQVANTSLGSSASIRRISEVIFIEAVRCCSHQSEHLGRLLEAISDTRISRAISAMHRSPAQAWTVDLLASEAAMSRSRFAERFQELVGCSPLAYLTEWRMQRARALVESSGLSIQAIAAEVGYRSPAAFSRAFTQMFGEAPVTLRRNKKI